MLEEMLIQQLNTGQSQAQTTCHTRRDGIRLYDFYCTRHWQFPCPQSSQQHYELLFCQCGQLRLELPFGRRVSLTEREILFLSDQNDLQRAFLSDGFQGILLTESPQPAVLGTFEDSDTRNILSQDIRNSLEQVRSCQGCAVIRSNLWNDAFFSALAKMSQAEQSDYCVLKAVEFFYLLSHRLLSLTPPATADYYGHHQTDVARQVHDDMMTNLGQSLTIAQLAARHHISQTMLKDCFRSLYGKPIHTFLREQRMRRAAELLRTTALPVIQIAAQVGYNSASQFGQAFRRQYHLSPSQYRRTAAGTSRDR